MSEFAENRRDTEDPIPSNLDSLLNEAQQISITQLTNIGWHLWFVRRPKFQPVIPVMLDDKSDTIAIIDEDGSVLEESIIQIRKNESND